MVSEYLYGVFNLLIVLSLVLILFFFIKKSKLSKFNKNKLINIVQIVSIGPKEKIVLVEAYGAFILLGATSTNIQRLHVFNQLESEEMDNQVNRAVDKFTLPEGMQQANNMD